MKTQACTKCGSPLAAPPTGGAITRSLCAACRKRLTRGGKPAAAAAPARAPAMPTELAGYHVVAPIARGAYGAVFRAVSPEGRTVALKVLTADGTQSNEAVQRFQREAQAAMNLSHPNIVRVYDAGYANRHHFIAMEYVGGTSLRDVLHEKKTPLEKLLALLRDVTRALQHAHDHGVIHRDLKPENVLITEEGIPKLSDFGIAKLSRTASTRLTSAGIALGTPEYMSPEQAAGRSHEVEPASDIYTLGVMLYETATGELPFRSRSIVETLRKIEGGAVQPPSQISPQVDARLEAVILKAMARLPHLRYPTAAELADELDRWLRGEPVKAGAPAPWSRVLGRMIGRKDR